MRGKILIYSMNKDLNNFVRDILGGLVSVKYYGIDVKIPDSSKIDFILAGCDYNCRLNFCAKKFSFLFEKRDVPFALIRPLYLEKKLKKKISQGFILSLFEKHHFSPLQERILQELKNSSSYASSSRLMIPFHPFFKVIKVQKDAAENPHLIFHLSNLAKKVNISPSCLSTKFKEISGISLNSFLVKLKCCHALWEMISTEKLIKTIALEKGYQPLYFSELIHSQFGISPSFIRKKLIADFTL